MPATSPVERTPGRVMEAKTVTNDMKLKNARRLVSQVKANKSTDPSILYNQLYNSMLKDSNKNPAYYTGGNHTLPQFDAWFKKAFEKLMEARPDVVWQSK